MVSFLRIHTLLIGTVYNVHGTCMIAYGNQLLRLTFESTREGAYTQAHQLTTTQTVYTHNTEGTAIITVFVGLANIRATLCANTAIYHYLIMYT